MKKSLSILRAAFPPWQGLDDPLLYHELRETLRTGRRPWTAIFLGCILILCEIAYLFYTFVLARHPYGLEYEEILGKMLGLLALALIALNTIGHWRLLFAITRRAARMITARRLRGDWDLIAITPMEKWRWYHAQMTALCWQVWPLTRQLVLAQTTLMLILFGLGLYGLATEGGSGGWDEQCVDWEMGTCVEYASSGYLPLHVYVLAFAPFGVLMACFPLVESALYASASLYPSSRSRNEGMSMLYSLITIYVVRLIMMIVFFCFGMIILMILSKLIVDMVDMGRDTYRPGVGDYLVSLLLVSPVNLGTAFVIEWFPYTSSLPILIPNTVENYLRIYVLLLLTFGSAYGVVPLGMIRLFASQTIRRLDKPEK
jgi:hypothetical protein